MSTINFNIPTIEEIEKVVSKIVETKVNEALNDYFNNETSQLLSFNKARKILGIGYDSLNRLVENEQIKTTSDGRKISLAELNRYSKRLNEQ